MRQWFSTALVTGALFLTAGCDLDGGGLFGSAQSYKEDFHARLGFLGINGFRQLGGNHHPRGHVVRRLRRVGGRLRGVDTSPLRSVAPRSESLIRNSLGSGR